MRRFVLLALLPLPRLRDQGPQRAVVKAGRSAFRSRGSDPAELLGPGGPAGVHSGRSSSDRRSALVDEQRVQGEATALGIDVSDDEVQRLVEQLARENHMDMTQFRQALTQQGLSMDHVRDSLKRQQLTMRCSSYR